MASSTAAAMISRESRRGAAARGTGVSFIALLAWGVSGAAFAQLNISGEWSGRYHEDFEDRVPGDVQGDFTGVPPPTCPWLVVIFAHAWARGANGEKQKNYYVSESVGIATGMLLVALHRAGLATLTHTPSPMGFLRRILGRPDNERAYMLIALGYPEKGCRVPDLQRKSLEQIAVEI